MIETALRLGIFDLLDRRSLDADSAIEVVVTFYTAADEIAAVRATLSKIVSMTYPDQPSLQGPTERSQPQTGSARALRQTGRRISP